MKNFKKVLFGVLAMLVMVTGVHAAGYNDVVAANEDELINCINTTDYTSVTCTLANDIEVTKANLTVDAKLNATLDLDGHTLTLTQKNVVVDGSLTIKGGTLTTKVNTSNLIIVNAGSSLNINGTTVKSNVATLIDITGVGAADFEDEQTYTNVTINGTLIGTGTDVIKTSTGYSKVNVSGKISATTNAITVDGYADVTVNANIVAGNCALYVAAGKLNVTGGTYTSTNYGIYNTTTNSGEITIANGTFKATNHEAILAEGAVITIKDGSFTSTDTVAATISNDKSVVEGGYFAGNTGNKSANYAIITTNPILKGGRYQSVALLANAADPVINGYKSVTAEGYTAVRIGDVIYVGTTHKLTIEVSNENGKSTWYVSPTSLLDGHTYALTDVVKVTANEGYVAKYVLVVDGTETVVEGTEFTMPAKDAKLVVTFVNPDEVKNPENQGEAVDPGTTGSDTDSKDETTDKNPGTFDGIASFVTLAVSSLGAAGYSIKKVIKR